MAEDRREWIVSLAGATVRITGESTALFSEPGILEPFLSQSQEWDYELSCVTVDSLPAPMGNLLFSDTGRKVYAWEDSCISYIGSVAKSTDGAYIRVERRGKISNAQFLSKPLGGRITVRAALTALEAEHLVTQQNGLLLHASCVLQNGHAILFTAPSGTGKSTQAALWERYRGAEIINGDRIVVRCTEEGICAMGIPFSGSSGICKNGTMPIRAIVYLSQGKENRIQRLCGVPAFRRIWEGCALHTWNRNDTSRATETAARLIGQIPVYHFACKPDETAVQFLEAELTE